jgi:PadR family transcriptional regulator
MSTGSDPTRHEGGDLLRGTLEMLVLKALALGPMHGWGVTDRIEQWSDEVLRIGQGSLYPALYRLEKQGYVRSEWRLTEHRRRARYYQLTASGRRRLAEERDSWTQFSHAVQLVLAVDE